MWSSCQLVMSKLPRVDQAKWSLLLSFSSLLIGVSGLSGCQRQTVSTIGALVIGLGPMPRCLSQREVGGCWCVQTPPFNRYRDMFALDASIKRSSDAFGSDTEGRRRVGDTIRSVHAGCPSAARRCARGSRRPRVPPPWAASRGGEVRSHGIATRTASLAPLSHTTPRN